jgi:nicotinamidase/pyrazinamidase
MPARIEIDQRDVLLVVDMQNDFLPGGALAVSDGDAIVPLINRLAKRFANVVLSQDWHPPGHASFASSHPDAEPFDTVAMPYGQQVLWPDHCVQGSPGAQLCDGLAIDHAILILRKGYHADTDSYSAFTEADGFSPAASPPIIASPGRLWTRAPMASRLSSSTTPAGRSTPMTRSVWLGQGWIRRK